MFDLCACAKGLTTCGSDFEISVHTFGAGGKSVASEAIWSREDKYTFWIKVWNLFEFISHESCRVACHMTLAQIVGQMFDRLSGLSLTRISGRNPKEQSGKPKDNQRKTTGFVLLKGIPKAHRLPLLPWKAFRSHLKSLISYKPLSLKQRFPQRPSPRTTWLFTASEFEGRSCQFIHQTGTDPGKPIQQKTNACWETHLNSPLPLRRTSIWN